jgi:chromosomal replication initiation ATPase DnaA
MSRQEKEFFVKSFTGSDENEIPMQVESNDDYVSVPEPVQSTSNNTQTQPEPSQPLSLPQHVANDSTPMENFNTSESNNNASAAEENLSEEQSLQISQFCEMTGSEPSFAKTVLEVCFAA